MFVIVFAANGDIRIPKGRAFDRSSVVGDDAASADKGKADDAASADKGKANEAAEMRAADNNEYSLLANIFIRPLNGAA